MNFQKKIFKYYYDPASGVFQGSAYKMTPQQWENLPFIEVEEFPYSDYRMDVETLELMHQPKPKNPRG